ncbi:guanine nucleotide exchange protein SMCR8 isoform X1 [Penaeus vannamei]|uniref:guanine nucleotide exchange protein SMCR8 isoform X1 n=1 Tax=Penaeus vannamei TaxID=6689 RepID=UPI00387FA88D
MARWQPDTIYLPNSSFPSGPLSLPPELDIRSTVAPPIYRPLTASSVNEEIILLAEFSEIEGPMPLLTIPQCQPSHLDLNDFVVKVMSTDYLNTSGEFRVCADTQMVQQDIEPGIHVYVHYFTLYDVRARGFVRPMCLSYISSDSRKLLHYFSHLRLHFSKATEYLKLSNLTRFTNEMQELITDLEYTKDRYIQVQRQFSVDMESSPLPQEMAKTPEEILNIQQLCAKNDDQTKVQRAVREIFSTAAATGIPHYNGVLEEAVPTSLASQGSDKRDLEEAGQKQSTSCVRSLTPVSCNLLSPDDDEEALLKHTSLEAVAMQLMECQHIMDIVKPHMDKKEIEEDLACLASQIVSKPQSPLYKSMSKLSMLNTAKEKTKPAICVLSLMKRNFRDMRSVQLLCGVGYISCLIKLQSIHERFSKPFLTLLFEDLDREIHENPFGSLFVGNIPVINVAKRKCDRPPVKPKSYSALCWDEHFVQFLDGEAVHETTPESEYSDAFDLPNDGPDVAAAADCLEVFPVMKASGGGTTRPTQRKEGLAKVSENKESLESKPDLPLLGERQTDDNTGASELSHQDPSQDAGGVGGSQHSSSSGSSWASIMPDLAGFEEIEEEEEVQEDIAMALGEELITYVGIRERIIASKACRLSGLVQQFCGVSHCLIHSLLSGRPVVLAAADQYRSLVMLYVRALSTLLPRSPRQKLPMLRWHTGTITSFHIQHYRVVGLCIPERLHVQDLMSNSTLNQVTVLNIETGHISGVAYSGTLVRGVEQYGRRLFHSNSALQAALQAILVTLGLKIYLLYHLLETTDRSANDILKGIGIAKGDWDIIKYLTGLIQSQLKNA